MSNDPKGASRSVVLRAALEYVDRGISILPLALDGSKQPAFEFLPRSSANLGRSSWLPFTERLPTVEEINEWFATPSCGIGIIGGAVSGGLEIIDFDLLEVFAPWARIVSQHSPDLVDRLVQVQSPRPGMHVYFRCPDFAGNEKLASQTFIDPQTGKSTLKCTIETRGKGGYCAAPPSPIGLHNNGIYRVVSHLPLTSVPTISSEERAVLFDAARQLDRSPSINTCEQSSPHRRSPIGNRPGDYFNVRGDWEQILRPHGWNCVGEGADGVTYWRRPGKVTGVSATVNYAETDLLYVFSSNAHPFEVDECYTKFRAYAILEHSGDFSSAAAALRRKGYGLAQRRPKRGRHLNIVPEYYLTTPLRSRAVGIMRE